MTVEEKLNEIKKNLKKVFENAGTLNPDEILEREATHCIKDVIDKNEIIVDTKSKQINIHEYVPYYALALLPLVYHEMYHTKYKLIEDGMPSWNVIYGGKASKPNCIGADTTLECIESIEYVCVNGDITI